MGRLMIFSILGSIKSLVWAMLVLWALFFMVGIHMTTGVIEYYTRPEFEQNENTELHEDLLRFFGRLEFSIMSLFKAMSGGEDWGRYYDALSLMTWTYPASFLVFICFCVFAVVNVVTGIFGDTAMQANLADTEVIVQEELHAKQDYLKSMDEIFLEMDADGTGCLERGEFEEKLGDERVAALFAALGLDVNDARMLFTLLDYDESGHIMIEEFGHGCYKLQGESRSLDMAVMQYEVKWLKQAITNLSHCVQELPSSLMSQYLHEIH